MAAWPARGPWHSVGPGCNPHHVRPALKQGLIPVWRDRDTLQVGIDSRRAVALTGLGGAAWLLSLLDGSRERAQVVAAAVDRGLPAGLADRVLTLLAAAGALDDYPAGTLRALTQAERARLAPELADASLAYGDTDGGARILARRQAARIHVCGPGPIAPEITAILTRAGVAEAVCTTMWPGAPARAARPHSRRPAAARPARSTSAGSRTVDDSPPGGPAVLAEGRPGAHESGRRHRNGQPAAFPGEAGVPTARQPAAGPRSGQAASAALPPRPPSGDPAKPDSLPPGRAVHDEQRPAGRGRRMTTAERRARALLAGREPRPDLVVLVGVPDPQVGERLMADGLPHLVAAGSEAIGIVGPLVVPGRTACLRCLDLTRAELDPAWPLILAQLAGRQADPPACGAVLTASVAAQAAAQALLFVDRPGQAGPAADGTLELEMPGWQWRRRTWPPHPDCTCTRR